MSKKREATIKNGNLEGLYPLLILLLLGLIRFIMNKKKKEEAKPAIKKTPLPTAAPMGKKKAPSVAPALKKTQKRKYTSLEVKKDEHFWRKKKQTRIQTLVASTENKQKLILLSEILKRRGF